MKIERRFTKTGHDVFSTVKWAERTSRITQQDGSVVFEMKDARVPAQWTQLATDIMVSKYFRKAGVPQLDAEGNIEKREDGSVLTGPERSAKQVIHRLCGCWRHWGNAHGYFTSEEDADAFYDELAYMLLNQMAAPNSPQWFNTGLNYAYGLTGPAQGHYIAYPSTGEVQLAEDAYTHPQPHACFIQSISDDLVNAGGIMDLWIREARLFKYGSGTGTNFSNLRGEGEPLSGGGSSSGLMSWLRIGDRAAGAIKSGGTTRRAAKMVCLDLDHPDIESFVNWKVREEIKVQALVEGMKHISDDEKQIADDLGLVLNYDFNGEAYYTVSGQNSNNSVRIPDEFFDQVDKGADWNLVNRTNGQLARSIPANRLWDEICYAAWRCADPGVQFDSTINAWHTCPEGGRINASNPCSEYMFLDNTACNLASLNLLTFYDSDTQAFDVESFEHAVRIWTIVLEISVLMAAFPSAEIARLSFNYRTLGLGFANLGATLMQAGIPYDSDEGRAICGSITAILTGRSYAVSAEIAEELGPFRAFGQNREHMLRVIRNHRRAAHSVSRTSGRYEELHIPPVPIDEIHIQSASHRFPSASKLLDRARTAWDEALDKGERHGFRNAQVSVIAPTGTIGLLMDCDTTGVEPDFALVKFKKLAGGGYFKIANNSLKPSLRSMGYSNDQIVDIIRYVMGTLSLKEPMPASADVDGTLADFLISKGFEAEDLQKVEDQLPAMFELNFAFNTWSLRPEILEANGIDIEAARADSSFNFLKVVGLSADDIEILNETICGTQTIEGAPHFRDEHLAVFDCANPCGKKGKRFIAPDGHIRMMGASQPFISGAISKTINLPHSASTDEISRCYRLSWELGLKANALYRDGSKLSQPLNTTTEDSKAATDGEDENPDVVIEAQAEIERDLTDVVIAVEDSDGLIATAHEGEERIHTVEKIVERIVERPLRRRLPDTRQSITHKFNVASHEGYLTVGMYENGQPGELFITMSKEGSTIGGLMDSLGTAISVSLQYGVPLESLVGKFSHQRFEPAGMTDNREIPIAKSLVDYIFRWLGIQFIAGYREQVVPEGVLKAEADAKAQLEREQLELREREAIMLDDHCDEDDDDPSSGSTRGGGGDVRTLDKRDATIEVLRRRLREAESNASSAEAPSANQVRNATSSSQIDSGYTTTTTAQAIAAGASSSDATSAPTTRNRLGNIGLDDPKAVRDAVVKQSPMARIQAGLRTIASFADRKTAEASALSTAAGLPAMSSASDSSSMASSALDTAMAAMMGDAPACDVCGSITVRNGTCYKCMNCGASMGCS